MMIVVFFLVSTALLILTRSLLQFLRNSSSKGRVPPGSLGVPVIGDSLNFVKALKRNDPWRFYGEKRAKYGPVFKMSLLGSPVVILPAPAGHKLLFGSEEKLVVNSWPVGFKRLLGPGSLTSLTGEDFKRMKKVFMSFLKPEALQRYVPRVSQLSLKHLEDHWEAYAGEEFAIYPAVKSFIFSLACSSFMSLETEEEQLELEEPFAIWTKGLLQLPLNIPGTLFHKALKRREVIHDLLGRLISKRRQELLQGRASETSDMLSVMLSYRNEDGKPACTDAEIKDNLLLLLFAAHDTSSSTLTLSLKFLAENPYWRNQVLQENLAISQEKSGQDGYSLEWDDLRGMKVSWRVLQETLRLQPPAPSGYRKVIQDFEFGDYLIPKGWKACWTVVSHKLPEFFPDPEKFDPSHFEGDSPAPYTYVPFGGGPRMCPGNEYAKMVMLVLLHHLVLRFDWQLADPDEGVTMDPMPMPQNGLNVKLHKRT
ncbi:hypothetical protein SELMODRAFT_402287 [Selaginella moellendorffii]|uniref:Uncharacterized protein CYP716J1 n=1 Tax=Selaginella moellendorffii TaxID=88036 RepID=D8QQ62_SELML|nr:cytochrome P450 716B1 [Selaginella moellendorffii]EFJ37735.1 hypothetical protein SELMODRAFT_402287 [Selaginella moellendorffii]|eukprot:XP_002960196.1 cytochrome P450 716B1 [Selaginella moellendorffii]